MLKAKDEPAQKVYVNQEGMTIIKCPVCACKKLTRVDSLLIREKNLRSNCAVRCACQKRFAVKLEFRRTFRKDSNFRGEYLSLPSGNPRGEMTIVNISRTGMGLQIDDTTQFKKGSELLILFNFGGTKDSLIELRAKIRVIKQNYIGCEFLGSSQLGKTLAAYLTDETMGEEQSADDDQGNFDWGTAR